MNSVNLAAFAICAIISSCSAFAVNADHGRWGEEGVYHTNKTSTCSKEYVNSKNPNNLPAKERLHYARCATMLKQHNTEIQNNDDRKLSSVAGR